MKLGRSFPELLRITLFLQQGIGIAIIFVLRATVFRYGPIFKLAICGHETWSLANVPEVAHILPFYSTGSKLSLFLLYGQRGRGGNQAYSRLSTIHGHITDCKLDSVVYAGVYVVI